MLDNFRRYQKGLTIEHLFPTSSENLCACGCGKELPKRKRKWHGEDCKRKALNFFYIIKGDTDVIRRNLYNLDKGFCRDCGVYSSDWHADHIIPVCQGGGACGLDNFQTLCINCHIDKTVQLDRSPDCLYVLTTRLNVFPSSNNTIRAFNQGVSKNIVRDAVSVSECATV